MAYDHNSYKGRMLFYGVTAAFAGSTAVLGILYILACEFDVHIINSIVDQAVPGSLGAGLIGGGIVGAVVDQNMGRYYSFYGKTLYNRRVLIEALILIFINIISLVCFILLEKRYSGYLFPIF